MRTTRFAFIALALVGLILAPMEDAHAISRSSAPAYYSDGAYLRSNAWMPTATFSSCQSFSTSAVVANTKGNRRVQWVKNTSQFYRLGVGGISIAGVSASGNGGSSPVITWTNNNGAKGSYLSGNVCGGWGTAWIGVNASGSALYNGQVKYVQARI